jgi:hypothetical protein
MSVQCRALGSKSALIDIANEIVRGLAKHVCVTMDRYYDGHLGRLIGSKNVIYTYGYSWEIIYTVEM